MPENEGMDFARLFDAKRAHQDDQFVSGVRETAETLHVYYEGQIAAGFTSAQAWDLTMQFHRLVLCKNLGLRP